MKNFVKGFTSASKLWVFILTALAAAGGIVTTIMCIKHKRFPKLLRKAGKITNEE